MAATKRSVEIPPLSLRIPRSLPNIIGNMSTGPGRDSPPMIRNVHNTGGPNSNTRSKAPHSNEKLQRINNILAIGNDPAIFNQQPRTRQTSCHYCGLFGSRRCSRCHITYYCSEECQLYDWKSHSVICRQMATEVTKEEKTANKGEDSKTVTKSPGTTSPPPRKKEEEGRRVMLSDLKVETLSEGMELEGYVSEFSSPSDFFLHVCNAKSMDKLVELSEFMNKIYSSPENLKKDYVPEIGEICVAKYFQDQQWYRVLVFSVEMRMKIAQVLYLDFGNQETLPLSGLQPMHGDLDLAPPGAVKVRVAYALEPPWGWSPECLVDMKRLLMGPKLSFRVVGADQKEPPQYAVEIFLPDSGKALQTMMEESGYSFIVGSKDHSAEVKPSEVLEEKQKTPDLDSGSPETQDKPVGFCVGDQFEALITVFRNPDMFFCQSVQNAKRLAKLLSALNTKCSTMTTTPLSLPEPGEVCCAQYTADNNWYRASVVKHTSDDTALVGYLDFGNTETLHISRLRPIDSDMLRLPFQAAQCRLAGVKPPSGTWSSEAVHKTGLLLLNKVFTARVVSESAGLLTLDLISNAAEKSVVVSQHLIAAGLAEADHSAGVPAPDMKKEEIPREPPSPLTWAQISQEREVMVCMLQSPGDFFCQIYDPADLNSLNDLNVSLGQYCAQRASEGYMPVKGDMCGAFFSDDGNWYRGQVQDCTPGGAATVYFLDYGNTEKVPMDKLRQIPTKFLKLPFQAIKCSLAGVKPRRDKWDRAAAEKFQSAVAGKRLRAKAVSKNENGCSVQLVMSDSGESVADVLLAEKVAVPDHSNDDAAVEPSPLSAASSPRRACDEYNQQIPRNSNQTSECPSASQPAPSVCEDLPKPAVVREEDARGVSAAQSWTSVDLPLNEPTEACVLKVRSPEMIYVFPKENRVDVEKLQQVMMEIFTCCNADTARPDYKPSVGDACCAKFSVDGQWYRAVVLEVSESMVEVVYADYGNQETLPFSSLRAIRERFLSPPMQITRCRLHGVAPGTHQWSQEGTQSLSDILLRANVVLTAQSVEAGIYSVSIEKTQGEEVIDVGRKLMMDGLVKSADAVTSTDVCKEREGCCCQELRKRVEKLELLFEQMIR